MGDDVMGEAKEFNFCKWFSCGRSALPKSRYCPMHQNWGHPEWFEKEITRLNKLTLLIRAGRTKDKRGPYMSCVVVERDWPMYDRVWGMIAEWEKIESSIEDLRKMCCYPKSR